MLYVDYNLIFFVFGDNNFRHLCTRIPRTIQLTHNNVGHQECGLGAIRRGILNQIKISKIELPFTFPVSVPGPLGYSFKCCVLETRGVTCFVASFSSQVFVASSFVSLKLYDKHRWVLRHSNEQWLRDGNPFYFFILIIISR